MKAFETLIHPFSKEEFFDKNWNKTPLFLTRDELTEHPLLTIVDVNEYLKSQILIYPFVRIVKTGQETEVSPTEYLSASATENMKVIDKTKLFAFYKNGYTIVVQWAHLTFDKLNHFVSQLSEETNVRYHINIYITPPNSKGFDAHYDTHAVFILQVSGTKEWNLYDSPYEMPTKELDITKEDRQKYRNIEPSFNLSMQLGDLLYIPCGVVHDAYTTENPSIHITLGCHEVRRIDILKQFAAEAVNYSFFRSPCYPILKDADQSIADELFLKEAHKLLSNLIDRSKLSRKHNTREDLVLEEDLIN